MSAHKPSSIACAINAVKAGSTASAAAKLYSLNVRSVRRALRAAGVDPLPRGRPPKVKPYPTRFHHLPLPGRFK